MGEGILNSNFSSEDVNENSLRPQSLNDFQGQDSIKSNLRVYITAALKRGEMLDHLFLSGPPGLGKTTLATIIANEMGAELKVTSAPALDKPKDLAGMLTSIEKNTVFFIDEIHRLKPAIEEMLYIAMEDSEIDWVLGQGATARSVRVPIAPFTLVGATTKPGNVASPLYSRFGIDVRLPLYSEKEIALVLTRSSKILGISIEDEAIINLAKCSRGTPRIANRILRRVRDFAEVESNGVITNDIIKYSLEKLEIDSIGLGKQDIHILENIIKNYGGGPVGAETLAITIGEGVETLEDFYEPFLIQRGFLQRTPRGRMVTELAYQHLGIDENYKKNKKGNIDNEDQRLLF